MDAKINLSRPLVAIQLDTTGTSVTSDRICGIHLSKLNPDGTVETKDRIINPEVPIPPETTEIHGITDEKAQAPDAPKFAQIAGSLLKFIKGCDLAGYNITKFTLPLLKNELERVGAKLDMQDVNVLDAMSIFHKKEPRDFSGALKHYLGRSKADAVGRPGGTSSAVLEILAAQVMRYDDAPRDVPGLVQYGKQDAHGEPIDPEGKLVRRNGRIILNFSKYRDVALDDMAAKDPGFLQWCLRSAKDLSEQVKGHIRSALQDAAEKHKAREPSKDADTAPAGLER